MLLRVPLELTRSSELGRRDGSHLRAVLVSNEARERSALSLREAAHEAAARASAPPDLATVWQDLMDRRINLHSAGSAHGRLYALARTQADPGTPRGPLSRIETAVVVRVFCGDQQKLVACELDIACSTASKWYTQGLAKLHLEGAPVPAAVVVAARHWASGRPSRVDARWRTFAFEGNEYFLFSVPKPIVPTDAGLTAAEREVASLLIEGMTRWEIADHRETSAQTIACQLRGIFSKFRLTGRYALIGRAAELGWFGPSGA
jgi:DNA-binding NarL/FixJ family response regulator